MGITNYDPKVLPQLLEFSHRYICDVLEDADRYREHRANDGGDAKMNKEDFRLAVQATVDFTSSGPPPREFLMEVASQKNNMPLPLVAEDKFGVRLPPDRYCLVNKNYVVLPSKRKRGANTAVGPWDMPPTSAAIEAAKEAKRARLKRKEMEDLIKDGAAKAEDEEAAAAVPKAKAGVDDDDDDYD